VVSPLQLVKAHVALGISEARVPIGALRGQTFEDFPAPMLTFRLAIARSTCREGRLERRRRELERRRLMGPEP
jgi:hypothetical protein